MTTIQNLCSTLDLSSSDFLQEPEGKEYEACQFKLNGRQIICRTAKQTPKKIGQFVTFWKRSSPGPIIPFDELDSFDYFMVKISAEDKSGLFLFPKDILIKKGIISTFKKEGKRAFRIYSPWDITISKQAIESQKWQSAFFYSTDEKKDIALMKKFFR